MQRAQALYSVMYRLGLKPWEIDGHAPELTALVDGWPGAPGRALDLGCGTGRQMLMLAQHGWEVVGVDFVQTALDQARARVAEAGLKATLLRGDVTRLGDLSLGDEFELVLDDKCFHGLSAQGRAAYAQGVSAVSKPGATLLLFALTPSRGRALFGAPAGVSRRDVERLFEPDFEMLEISEASRGPFTPNVYRMRRRSSGFGIAET
jgi:SAM-dependent methyltransferase